MNNAKKSLKLKQDKSEIEQNKGDILKTAKMLPKINQIDKEKKHNEEIPR